MCVLSERVGVRVAGYELDPGGFLNKEDVSKHGFKDDGKVFVTLAQVNGKNG